MKMKAKEIVDFIKERGGEAEYTDGVTDGAGVANSSE